MPKQAAVKVDLKRGTCVAPRPKELGAAVDLLYELRQLRRSYDAVSEAVKAQESALKDDLLNRFGKDKVRGASGSLATAEVDLKSVPQAEDWDRVWAHVRKTGEFELLQKRLNAAAVAERWDAGKAVPGVRKFVAVVVTARKRRKN